MLKRGPAPDALLLAPSPAVLVSHLSLALLFMVSVFNYTDRYMIAILLPTIKREFQLSDTQMGFLTGVAFTTFYVLAGIPIARIADKYSRKTLLSLALAVWSLTTAACGLAQNFVQLAIMRTLVGIGEAGSSPPCYSLISDLYPPKQRATAMAIYLAGAPAGILVGFILGGWLTELYGWRVALVSVGTPGLLFAFVLAKTLKDPPRGQMDGARESAIPMRFKNALMALLSKRTFWHTALGTAFYNALIVAYVNWLPSFYVRSHVLGISRMGLLLALVMGPSQLIGVIVGGSIADRIGKHDARWYLIVPATVILLAAPLFMISLVLTSTKLALFCLVVPLFLGAMQTSPPFAVTHSLVDARMRAVASAVLILIINVVSGGLGPILVGGISDLLQPHFESQSLRYALLLVTPTFCVWAALHFFLAAKYLHSDLAVKQSVAAPGMATGTA